MLAYGISENQQVSLASQVRSYIISSTGSLPASPVLPYWLFGVEVLLRHILIVLYVITFPTHQVLNAGFLSSLHFSVSKHLLNFILKFTINVHRYWRGLNPAIMMVPSLLGDMKDIVYLHGCGKVQSIGILAYLLLDFEWPYEPRQ